MELYTSQLSQWRSVKALNIPYIDTTIKSGLTYFSPTWEMVSNYKKGLLSEQEYTLRYFRLMTQSQINIPKAWKKLFNYDQLCIMCYCQRETFCHRHLLKNIIKDYAEVHEFAFQYRGEITKQGIINSENTLPH